MSQSTLSACYTEIRIRFSEWPARAGHFHFSNKNLRSGAPLLVASFATRAGILTFTTITTPRKSRVAHSTRFSLSGAFYFRVPINVQKNFLSLQTSRRMGRASFHGPRRRTRPHSRPSLGRLLALRRRSLVLEQKSRGDRRPRPPRKSRKDGCPHPSSRAKLDAYLSNPNSRPDLLRIQIKSTRCRHSDGAYKCHIDSNGVPYREGMIDFIAAYVIPDKVWYIIPLAATRGQTEILLAPNRPHSKYAQFKEAWHLLRNE